MTDAEIEAVAQAIARAKDSNEIVVFDTTDGAMKKVLVSEANCSWRNYAEEARAAIAALDAHRRSTRLSELYPCTTSRLEGGSWKATIDSGSGSIITVISHESKEDAVKCAQELAVEKFGVALD